jgi:hypothetical protein
MKDGRCITPEHRITVHKKPKQKDNNNNNNNGCMNPNGK